MKWGIAVFSLLLASTVLAGTPMNGKIRKPAQQTAVACPSFGSAQALDKTVALVSAAKSCYEASNIAIQCAVGSSEDVQPAGAAITTCEKDFLSNMSASDKGLYKGLNDRCVATYSRLQGTMFGSMQIFCNLAAAKFFSDIYQGSKLSN